MKYDIPRGAVEVAGKVTAKRREEWINEPSNTPEFYGKGYHDYISLLGREFHVSRWHYNSVTVGDEVTLTLARWWWKLLTLYWCHDVRKITPGTKPTAHRVTTYWPPLYPQESRRRVQEAQARLAGEAQDRREIDRQRATESCAFLISLGVNANVSEPASADPAIEILEGPIQRVVFSMPGL